MHRAAELALANLLGSSARTSLRLLQRSDFKRVLAAQKFGMFFSKSRAGRQGFVFRQLDQPISLADSRSLFCRRCGPQKFRVRFSEARTVGHGAVLGEAIRFERG